MKRTFNENIYFLCFFIENLFRCKGYPEPVVTWRREDGNEIILKDSMGTKTHGKLEGMNVFSHWLIVFI